MFEFMSEYTFELLCIPTCVCCGSLRVFLQECGYVHTHTHTQGRTLGSPNMLNGPLRLLHVGRGVGVEGGQREAAGFCKNIKSQIK